MAGFDLSQASNYGGQGGGGFFSLRSDKEVARVRILYSGVDDPNCKGFSVHEVEIGGKKRYVNCLREYGDPVTKCPFCKAGMYTAVKYFVPLYVEAKRASFDATVETPINAKQTWERGKQFGSKLSTICSRYPNTVSHIFEIERKGQPNDTKTNYEIFEIGKDDTTLDKFEVVNPLGSIILDKSAQEMEEYLRTRTFPNPANNTNGGYNNGASEVVRRDVAPAQGGSGYVRRTPATGNGSLEEFD